MYSTSGRGQIESEDCKYHCEPSGGEPAHITVSRLSELYIYFLVSIAVLKYFFNADKNIRKLTLYGTNQIHSSLWMSFYI